MSTLMLVTVAAQINQCKNSIGFSCKKCDMCMILQLAVYQIAITTITGSFSLFTCCMAKFIEKRRLGLPWCIDLHLEVHVKEICHLSDQVLRLSKSE